MKTYKRRRSSPYQYVALTVSLVAIVFLLQIPPAQASHELIEEGRRLFFNETFDGNGRTCGTCHREERNFTIDPAFIATLPPDDPLFVAEFNPQLATLERPDLMRRFGLILENTNGFGDLANNFTMRGVPHTLALPTSIDSPDGPRLGWSGDGSPNDGTLRSFAIGAVIQHLTKTLNRVPGVDFRLPTDAELDALEAFQASLGRQAELALPLPLKDTVVRRGQEIFLDDGLGKCSVCHGNAGANLAPGNNANFDTGVENQADRPQIRFAAERGIFVPRDDGLGNPGDGTFNTPVLVEAADTGPFFHDNSVETIEGAVAFYDSQAFQNSPSGQFLASIDPGGVGIRLEATQVVAVAAFLRAINTLESIRQSIVNLKGAFFDPKRFLPLAADETRDSIRVLSGASLHPDAVEHLEESIDEIRRAAFSSTTTARNFHISEAIEEQEKARAEIINES